MLMQILCCCHRKCASATNGCSRGSYTTALPAWTRAALSIPTLLLLPTPMSQLLPQQCPLKRCKCLSMSVPTPTPMPMPMPMPVSMPMSMPMPIPMPIAIPISCPCCDGVQLAWLLSQVEYHSCNVGEHKGIRQLRDRVDRVRKQHREPFHRRRSRLEHRCVAFVLKYICHSHAPPLLLLLVVLLYQYLFLSCGAPNSCLMPSKAGSFCGSIAHSWAV